MIRILDYKNINNYIENINNDFPPVYIITGTEQLLINETIDKIYAHLQKYNFHNYASLVMDSKSDWLSLLNSIATLNLFNQNRIFNINISYGNIGKLGSDTMTKIAMYIKKINPVKDILIIQTQKNNKIIYSSWMKTLMNIGTTINISSIKQNNLPIWIKNRLKEQGQFTDIKTIEWMANNLENNLLGASQEIEKLSLLFPKGELSYIEVKDSMLEDISIYNLSDFRISILRGDFLRLTNILHYFKTNNIFPIPLLIWGMYEDIKIIGKMIENNHSAQFIEKLNIFGNHKEAIIKYSIKIKETKLLENILTKIHDLDLISKGLIRTHDIWSELHRLAIEFAKLKY
ncbi:DNA polymerase III subunit delta [Candidatus Kinetoplastibacterium oncopeltii TCC290E]|uniref:DNA polymerase III subunit delta n=1 Tax=Candidatus Kinetoplastidibacterium stringomonadis TCC290E TaxID=1208920 RepID=M1L6H6_9PROT|nr:DNA polymerase III subunit delta [Candidatus Kinetoplastibacterium oncopeltii]AGF48188.1 DNA polymerase III subunit delta [Candidatus Kinetoplastibacterium oncopeltii TCC290E]